MEDNISITTTRTDSRVGSGEVACPGSGRGIARGAFAPDPGYHCAFCPYRNLCPATEKIVTTPQKKSSAPRAELVILTGVELAMLKPAMFIGQ
jgi:hypothetical protein